jgi:hypothetical protein
MSPGAAVPANFNVILLVFSESVGDTDISFSKVLGFWVGAHPDAFFWIVFAEYISTIPRRVFDSARLTSPFSRAVARRFLFISLGSLFAVLRVCIRSSELLANPRHQRHRIASGRLA